jgi:hypothetical protein
LLRQCFSTNDIVTCEANLNICGSGEAALILKMLTAHLRAWMDGFGRSRNGQPWEYHREIFSGHLFHSGNPSNMNGLSKVERGEDTPGLIADEYGCWMGAKIHVAVVGRHSSVPEALGPWEGKGAVLEEDMWVRAAMKSWIREPLIPSRQSSDLISHDALWLLMQQTFSFVRQCCRLP